jgi:hypothetical protein
MPQDVNASRVHAGKHLAARLGAGVVHDDNLIDDIERLLDDMA